MTTDTDNPLLDLPLDLPFDRIRAEHVEPGIDQLIAEARDAIDAIAARPGLRTYDDTLGALEAATERLERAMNVVGHLEGVATTPRLRDAYSAARPRVSQLYSSIPLNEGLWRALREVDASEEARTLSPTRARFLKKSMDDFRRHGAELDASGKERLAEIDVQLSKLTTKFSQNVLDATNDFDLLVEDEARLAGLPGSAIEAAREDAKRRGRAGYRFTLQAPSMVPLLTYLDDAVLREEVWRAYNARASRGKHDNRELIVEVLRLRREKARLLGYAHFADLVLEDRMAGSGAEARRFVDELRQKTSAHFDRERGALIAFRQEQGDDTGEMRPWDVAYWSEKQRKALYDFDDEELRPYFPADAVLDGLFETVQRLYGVRIEAREDARAWDPSVRAYRLVSQGGHTLGLFYVDLHPRENKQGGAWMSGLITSAPPEPHVGLFCANVSPPIGGRPALLRHREVETLFHEFGHLMHHLLSEVSVRSLGGAQVAWDFVELPSQIMENWCWEKEALNLFARHYETGETIPDALFDKMLRARTYRAATMQMRQLGFATTDLALHVDWDPETGGEVLEVARRILEEHAATELPDDYAMLCGFSHLFASPVAYAAGYYSYKWAEVLDADAFTRFREEGVFSPSVGARFREAILSKGDSRDPMELYRDFMGREPRLEPLLERQGLSEGSTS